MWQSSGSHNVRSVVGKANRRDSCNERSAIFAGGVRGKDSMKREIRIRLHFVSEKTSDMIGGQKRTKKISEFFASTQSSLFRLPSPTHTCIYIWCSRFHSPLPSSSMGSTHMHNTNSNAHNEIHGFRWKTKGKTIFCHSHHIFRIIFHFLRSTDSSECLSFRAFAVTAIYCNFLLFSIQSFNLTLERELSRW